MKMFVSAFMAVASALGLNQSVDAKTYMDLHQKDQNDFQQCTVEKMNTDEVAREAIKAIEKSSLPLSEQWKELAVIAATMQIAHNHCADKFGIELMEVKIIQPRDFMR